MLCRSCDNIDIDVFDHCRAIIRNIGKKNFVSLIHCLVCSSNENIYIPLNFYYKKM